MSGETVGTGWAAAPVKYCFLCLCILNMNSNNTLSFERGAGGLQKNSDNFVCSLTKWVPTFFATRMGVYITCTDMQDARLYRIAEKPEPSYIRSPSSFGSRGGVPCLMYGMHMSDGGRGC